MVELEALSPLSGQVPETIGAVSLSPLDLGQMSLIMPFSNQRAVVQDLLQKEIGLGLPGANQALTTPKARLMWFGRDSYLLTGAAAPASLHKAAAVVDQSDAWVCVELSGAGIEDVLARLVPVDLRPQAFGPDASIRTLVGHMSASLTRLSEERIAILVFRSMADTLVEEIKEAMEAVAARG